MTDRRPSALLSAALLASAFLTASGTLAEGPLAAAKPASTTDTGTADVLTLERIMADPDWIGTPPENPYWADDGNAILYTRKREGEIHRDLWRLPVETPSSTTDNPMNGAPIPDPELGSASVSRGQWSRDRQRKVYSREGDLFIFDRGAGQARQLTRTTAQERAAHFMANERQVSFQRGESILIRDLDTGLEAEAADLRTTDDPGDEAADDDFLRRQQERLFEIVRLDRDREEARRERGRERQAVDPTRAPLPWFLGKKTEIVQRSLSPTGDWLLLVVTDAKRDEGRNDAMPNYVTADGYVENEEVRVKVGDGDPTDHRLWLLDLTTHERFEIDLAGLEGLDDDPLAEIKAATAARRKAEQAEEEKKESDGEASEVASEAGSKDQGKKQGKGKKRDNAKRDDKSPAKDDESETQKARPVEITAISWTRDGQRAAVQVHSADNKDRWIGLLTRDARTLDMVHHVADPEGWINWSFNVQQWLDDGQRLLYVSEESGWSQLYVHDVRDGATRRLTDGDYVVDDLDLSPDERYVYYTANPDHPGTYDTYRVAIEDGTIEQITRLGGLTSSQLSPGGEQLLITHSSLTRPPELFLQAARPGATARRVTHTISPAFEAIDWTVPDIVAVPSSHQARPIYSRVYEPKTRHESAAPAVVFVHGAGYLQNAHSGWSGYFREFMFHSLLNQAGFVVLDMDYRASRGYGRDWRTAIYRQMGTPEVEDLADGVDWLVDHRNVDRDRVGVYGGSYGGFLTFMAMFTQPDLFAAGAALRPVTDWAHYNHPYTSNILNTPDVDPEAYARSSPIEFAEGLAKPLLICTGMQDDNVFFQDSVRLVQRLIELEKTDFEMAVYPIEPHGFREPFSWLDEYRRIFALFERYLLP